MGIGPLSSGQSQIQESGEGSQIWYISDYSGFTTEDMTLVMLRDYGKSKQKTVFDTLESLDESKEGKQEAVNKGTNK
ncbi:hypothetical protein DUI87_20071 [Hirundo rustica rustica]|uniref:Uncharacterized protein n=1 Tax=Hirundo rustica rustica TaxID=333673 RepID=A0A3M0JPC8_HIRRU|nr:hypothetical protein DUI87_20071 [Hirundo rustica rustica]